MDLHLESHGNRQPRADNLDAGGGGGSGDEDRVLTLSSVRCFVN